MCVHVCTCACMQACARTCLCGCVHNGMAAAGARWQPVGRGGLPGPFSSRDEQCKACKNTEAKQRCQPAPGRATQSMQGWRPPRTRLPLARLRAYAPLFFFSDPPLALAGKGRKNALERPSLLPPRTCTGLSSGSGTHGIGGVASRNCSR